MERKRVISSLFYKFVESLSVKGIGIIISVILARLISPDDFGQVAIITVFINLSNTFIQSGLNSALVQKKSIDEKDYSTVFYISLSIAFLMVGLLYFSAPFISDYYEKPAIITPLRFYSISLLFGAFNSVQIAKLQREMRFKVMMYCNLTATIISGTIGIISAYLGMGIWALVIYYFSNTVASCFAMIFVAKWFPKLVFSFERGKILFLYGWKMLVSALLCSVYNDIRSLIIGKKFSAESLGYYNRGEQFPYIVSTTADNAIQSVMFPTLSNAQEEKDRLKSMLKRSMTTGALIIIPAMLGIAAIAESLVLVLFGEQWLPCVLYMQLICIAHAHIPFTSSNLILVKAIGRSDLYMKFEIVRRIAMLIGLAISVFCFNSVKAIAIGYAISAWIDVVIVLIPMKKIIGYSIFEQFKDVWKIILASVLMCGVVLLFSNIAIPVFVKMCFQIILGLLTYILLCVLLKIESFSYILQMVKSFSKK